MWKFWIKIIFTINLLSIFRIVYGSDSLLDENIERQKRALLFPRYTTLQTSMCLISQISSLPSHRVALNIGFQINYNLPYELPSFYSPIFWARKLSRTTNPLVNFFERMVESDDEIVEMNNTTFVQKNFTNHTKNLMAIEDEVDETTELLDVTDSQDDEDFTEPSKADSTEKPKRSKRMLPFVSDLSAGLFYNGLLDVFQISGYHDDCLLKSVCELAKHPLAKDDKNEDIVREIVHLLLTPSVHQSFDPENEAEEKELYEEAEKIGSEGGDCDLIYSECTVSPLHSISNFI